MNPLSGLRVVELTTAWAGPMTGRFLGALGADVIKVESGRAPDLMRVATVPKDQPVSIADGTRSFNVAPTFNALNRNKRAIAIDLAHPEGKAILLRIVAQSDVVISNYTSRVLPNLGLAYHDLAAVRQDIVLLNMPTLGATGPDRAAVGYGAIIEAMSGQAVRFGYRHEEARVSRIYFPDPVAGTHALVALLAALRRRTDTGLGCEIDLSQQETMWMQLGEGIVYRSMTGREPARMENGEPGCVPSGMFPCLDDRWIALVVSSDTQFGALVRATHGQLAEFVGHDRALRVANRVPIERALRSFTAGQARDRILENFRREGVPSAPANGFAEAVDAVRLSRNQWYEDVDHPEARVRTYLRLVQRLDGAPLTTQRPAPCFGEHTREVLLELAGLDDVAIDRLYERGVLATEPEFA